MEFHEVAPRCPGGPRKDTPWSQWWWILFPFCHCRLTQLTSRDHPHLSLPFSYSLRKIFHWDLRVFKVSYHFAQWPMETPDLFWEFTGRWGMALLWCEYLSYPPLMVALSPLACCMPPSCRNRWNSQTLELPPRCHMNNDSSNIFLKLHSMNSVAMPACLPPLFLVHCHLHLNSLMHFVLSQCIPESVGMEI